MSNVGGASEARGRGSRVKRLGVAGSALALVAMSLAACGASGDSASGGAGSTITIGTIAPLSGPSSALGQVATGLKAYFDNVNAKGGINGHQIKVEVGNDQYNPALTPGVASQLVGQKHVQMMCGVVGSPSAAAIKPFLASQKIADVAPASGSPTLIDPVSNTEFETVPAYEPLAAGLVKYAVQKLHKKHIAIAYTSDDVGLPALSGVEWELKQLHMNLAAKVEFSLTSTSLASQAAKLKASGADFVILWHVPEPFALMVNNANQIGYHPTWGGAFFAASPTFASLTKNTTSGNAYFVSPLDSTTTSDSASYRAAMSKYESSADPNDINAMQGWTLADSCGSLITAATANGQSLTPDSIAKAGNSLSVDDDYVHGLKWTQSSHVGLNMAQVLKQQGSKFVPVTQYETLPPAPTTAG